MKLAPIAVFALLALRACVRASTTEQFTPTLSVA
jgi:hypothetical protein